jgi:nitroreductase
LPPTAHRRAALAGAALGLLGLAAAGSAIAACAPPARPAAHIIGIVREAASGSVLCVQTGRDPARLTRVRLADVSAPRLTGPGGEGAKWALRRLARNRTVDCRMEANDKGVGVCAIDGAPIGEGLKRQALRQK